MLTTTELTVVLVRMKARLAYGRQAKGMALINAIGFVLGFIVTGVAIAGIVAARTAGDSATQVMLLLTGIALAWAVFSILVGAGEHILDPGRFAVFPVTIRQLIVAFLCASFVGVLAPGTAIAALATVSHAPTILSGVVIAFAALIFAATSVLSGRLGIAAMSSLVRGRRSRELAGAVTVLIAITAGLVPQFAIEVGEAITPELRSTARSIVRWLPWGWGPESIALAAEGRVLASVGALVAATGFAVLLGEAWRRIMVQILTTRPAASEATSIEGGLVPRTLRPLGRSPMIAATARSLRQLRRDPREFLEMASFLPLVLVSALPALDAIRDRNPETVLATVSVGAAIGLTALNMFGADARSFGVDSFAHGDITPIIKGKGLARVLVGAPLVFIAAFLLAAITNGWAFVPAGLAVAFTGLLAMVAVGMQVSVRYPFPLPEQAGSIRGSGGAAGCAVGLIRLVAVVVALLVAGIGAAPVGAITLFVSPLAGAIAGVVAIAYGVLLFWLSGRSAGRRATQQTPEIYQTLSTPLS